MNDRLSPIPGSRFVLLGYAAFLVTGCGACVFADSGGTPVLRVWSIAFSPDGNYLAAAAGGSETPGRVTLWDLGSRQPRWSLNQQLGFTSVAFAPDGRSIAAGNYDHTARLIDATTGHIRLVYRGHGAGVNSVSFSPDGRRLATAGLDKLVKIWDTLSGDEQISLAGHDEMAITVAFAPDGRHVASAGRDRKALLWDLQAQRIIRVFAGHTSWIQQVVFSRDGRTLATASYDSTARVWDVDTGRLWCKLEGAAGDVPGVAFLADASEIATASRDKTIRVYTVTLPDAVAFDSTAATAAIDRLDSDSYDVREAAMGELGRFGLAAQRELQHGAALGKPREMRVRCQRLLERLDSPPVKRQLHDQPSALQSLALSPDGNLLAIGLCDGPVKLFNARNLTEIATFDHRGE